MKKTLPVRASPRVAEKKITKYAEGLPSRNRKRIESILKKNKNVWRAVRSMYNLESGNTTSRNVVSEYFQPSIRKYNASKNTFVTGRNANRAINRSIRNKSIVNMLVPLHGVKRGGVNPAYITNALKNANIKYAIVNNHGKLKSIAFIKNKPNSRYINVISGFTSYGHPMMNRILANARNAGKNRVNLMAVTNTNNNSKANNDALVRWYMGKGFRRSGTLNTGGLLPMTHKFNI